MEARTSDEQDSRKSSSSNESSNVSIGNSNSSTEPNPASANMSRLSSSNTELNIHNTTSAINPGLDAMIERAHEVFLKYALYTPEMLAELPKIHAEYKVTYFIGTTV